MKWVLLYVNRGDVLLGLLFCGQMVLILTGVELLLCCGSYEGWREVHPHRLRPRERRSVYVSVWPIVLDFSIEMTAGLVLAGGECGVKEADLMHETAACSFIEACVSGRNLRREC